MPHLVLIPALAYLLYVAISTILAFDNPEQLAVLTVESEQLDQEKTETKQMDFLVIKDWHLFGQSAVISAQNSEQQGTPQETQLQLKLLGVFFLPEQKRNSYAIIETDDHIQKKYRPDDELPGGATLQSIATEQVILLRNNQRESLSMDRKKTGLLFKTN
ncbi:type II secretion system protein N [Methylobacter sp.]|uniref:type II secretion system protein N n=1 Tax=Methylobacter sp. TaxID=2051955 RepID=UPI0025D3DB50|nr:type II secretion system protein N [Methylobacter sp.]